MRLKKAKYILLLLCLIPFGQLVFSRERAYPASSDESFLQDTAGRDSLTENVAIAHAAADSVPGLDSPATPQYAAADSAAVAARDTSKKDTAQRKSFLDDVISGKNQDSLVYDLRNKTVYIYEKGDVDYQDKNLTLYIIATHVKEQLFFH